MIVFSTCWYIFKNKFNNSIYSDWIHNLLSNVQNFKLVIYTNNESKFMIEKYSNNPNIKIVILEIHEFYNYKYKDFWIKNHDKNIYLNQKIDWFVNMLWNEKISFVQKTFKEKYFMGDWFGWLDIGYFRNRHNDIKMTTNWPNPIKINSLNPDKIYYAKINNNKIYINNLFSLINNKLENGLSKEPIPPQQISIAGGFFILFFDKVEWYHSLHDKKLNLYIQNNRLVKDDQIIVADNIFSNISRFNLVSENLQYDNWFLFQRFLL